MSAHFVRRRLAASPRQTPTGIYTDPSMPLNPAVQHLDRPHANVVIPIPLFQMVILVITTAVLITLLIWFVWITFDQCFGCVRHRINVRKNLCDGANCASRGVRGCVHQGGRAVHQGERVPKFFVKVGRGLGRAAGGVMNGFNRGEEAEQRYERDRRGEDEGRGLLRDSRLKPNTRYLFGEGFAYAERDSYGEDGSRDSMSTAVLHREECTGECGQPRRRSGDV